MKNVLFLLWGICLSANANAQILEDSLYLAPYTWEMQVENGKMRGEGSTVLKKAAREARYLLLGEYHGSARISRLTAALLPELQPLGYRHFVMEVGPYSARLLADLAADPESAEQRLRDFNSRYFIPEDEDLPIPFVGSREAAAFLAAASRHAYQLHGVDQEYFSSPLMWADHLLEMARGRAEFARIQADKSAFDSLFRHCYRLDMEQGRGYRLFQALLQDTLTAQFFRHFPPASKGGKVVEALRKSWDIYDRNDRRGGYSHLHRVAYIRKNLSDICFHLPKGEKVVVKTGSFHAAKNAMSGTYDLGSLTADLARRNGEQSLNIYCLSRWFEGEDVLENQPDNPYRAFRRMGAPDRWTLIDLRPIREDMIAGRGPWPEGDVRYHIGRHLAENFDLLLIPPMDGEGVPNFEKRSENFSGE